MLTGDGPSPHSRERAQVLLARKQPGWSHQRRYGEVESEAMATPIIKGTLVIESEETI
jgi:hypothetical protein